jgi:hypothetical protein
MSIPQKGGCFKACAFKCQDFNKVGYCCEEGGFCPMKQSPEEAGDCFAMTCQKKYRLSGDFGKAR